ncbi:MAG: oligosaccharide flippase family protein [Ferruginibacter sp.]
MSISENNKRIAKNTSLLYFRMIFVMGINLYSVRLVLNALGVEDYGIFNVIAGVIIMLNSISSVLSTATQRYYSYSIGENKLDRLRNIFSTSIYIYVILSLIIIILGETVGLWFINTQLVIPDERMNAANWIYQFSIFSFVFSIMQVPYSAATIAHEDLGIFAVISTVESVLKLIGILLIFVIPYDRLIIYGASLLLISLMVLISYILVGYRKYAECRYQKPTEKSLFKDLLSFSGWSLFGSIAGVGMAQVNTILVNIFFGPLVNAARAISFQLDLAMSSFVGSFIMAIRAPMIKSYAEESYLYLNKIFNLSNKFIYYCLLMICLPLLFEMDTVLFLWLRVTDPQTVLFSRLMVVYTLIMSLNNPIAIIIQATGRIREYNVPVETITLLCVPATYILFKSGYPAYTTYIVMIIAAVSSHLVRLICLKKFYKPFSYSEYIKEFIIPALAITIITYFLIFLIHRNIKIPTLRIVAVFFSSITCVGTFALLIGLSKSEKEILKNLVISLKRKIGVFN